MAVRPQDFDTGPKPLTLRNTTRRWSRRGLLVATAVALCSALAVGFFIWGRPPLAVVACQLDAAGQTQLLLTCTHCKPGSVVYFGDAVAPIEAGKATLGLHGSLPPGDNSIALSLVEPNEAPRRQTLEVTVPVALSTELVGLNESPPRVSVVIHALPASAVVIDGQAVSLDAFGRARHTLDLTSALTGLAPQTEQLARRIAYTVTPPTGAALRGELALNLPIAPLTIEAPGERVVTQSSTFMLAGSTLPDAVVTVAGRPIAVDARGSFAQLMNISSPGKTSVAVRASVPGQAPRLFSIELVRSKDLNELAVSLRPERTQSYAALRSGAEARVGWLVALQGRVSSVTSQGYRSELQLAVSPCVERECPLTVRYAGPDAPRARQRVEVFGKVLAAAPENSPLVEAEFFLDKGSTP